MRPLLTLQQQLEIGAAVARARAAHPKAPWKLLQNTYARSRMQLNRYMRAAEVAAKKDVTSGQMLHLPSCEAQGRPA